MFAQMGLVVSYRMPFERVGCVLCFYWVQVECLCSFFCLIFVNPAPVLGGGGDICHVIPMSTVGR